jgi:dimethylaniline monooxygenase (N-oxide forming)
MKRLPLVCVIGAGSSGIAMVKALHDRGIPFDCFEKSDRVGGNWVFKNRNGMSSAYRSLHVISSRRRMQYADFPMPEHYPEFPHHSLVAAYLDAYVDHFDLRRTITFETTVERADRLPDHTWRIRLSTGEERCYDALAVANGHHWNPMWPDPPYPGPFDGHVMHSHEYIDPQDPHDLRGKRVVVVGAGNSALDIACELSNEGVAARVFLAVRRGVYIVPHYIRGKPLDQGLKLPIWLPASWRMSMATRILRRVTGDPGDFGLPAPDHLLGQSHPSVSSDILPKLGHGDIVPKPNIARLMGDRVAFEDGSVEPVDAIVYGTGYRITFPFFDESFLSAPNNDLPLFRRVFRPDMENLFFIALLQPLGAFLPIAEAQAKWVAEYLAGEYALPSNAEMMRQMSRERRTMFRRYVPSRRHTMQVDFEDYLHALQRERRAGRKRARQRDHALPVPARAQDVSTAGSR